MSTPNLMALDPAVQRDIEARAVLPGYGLRQCTDVGLLLMALRDRESALTAAESRTRTAEARLARAEEARRADGSFVALRAALAKAPAIWVITHADGLPCRAPSAAIVSAFRTAANEATARRAAEEMDRNAHWCQSGPHYAAAFICRPPDALQLPLALSASPAPDAATHPHERQPRIPYLAVEVEAGEEEDR